MDLWLPVSGILLLVLLFDDFGGGYAIMSDYGDDYGFDDYASYLIWGSDVTVGFEEAFRRCVRLKQRAHNRFHNRSHN